MCTVTWCQAPGSSLLLFNRDEKKTRRPGLPPRVASQQAVTYISPRDAEHGGTWLWVNAFGLIAGLLNYYPQPPLPEPRMSISRGLLLQSCVADPDLATLGKHLQTKDLSPYRPFTLIALQPDHPARQWRWDGRHLAHDRMSPASLPLTSSSYRSTEVEATRRETYRRLLSQTGRDSPDEALLNRYHYQHWSECGAFSVCLLRDDAETESISRIAVTQAEIRFSYMAKIPKTLQFRKTVHMTSPRVSVHA